MSAKLRVPQLRAALSLRGLDTTGLKPVLVARLDEAIRAEENEASACRDDGGEGSQQGSSDVGPSSCQKDEEPTSKRARTIDEVDDVKPTKRAKTIDLDKMTVAALRSALIDLGLPTGGNKAQLKERLTLALKNQASSDLIGVEGDDSLERDRIVTVKKKGRATLDQFLPSDIQRDYHVIEQGDNIYDAMLNQTNVDCNNNKFYVIQALEHDKGGSYYLFTRWGRVGVKGQTSLLKFSDVDSVLMRFEVQFKSKTKNNWADRMYFTPHAGKYTWLEMDYQPEEKQQARAQPLRSMWLATPAPSKLDPAVGKLISVICNINMMQQQMMEIGYDATKMPLGKLSKATIRKGFEVLQRIAGALDIYDYKELQKLSGDFYTVIPHDFGRQKMKNFIINTKQILKQKLEMVEALGEIELASTILGNIGDDEEDPTYHHYKRLKCEIQPVGGDEANWIKSYVKNTHGHSHSEYSLEVQEIYRVRRDGEDIQFQQFAGVKNRMLLWHGSRLCNWTGILSQGLRIAPPEAPVTGYMFGKGVYFADMVSKSANYCYTTRQEPVGILLLCEVALGDMNELLNADYHADVLPPGKLSTKGVGVTAPDPGHFMRCPDGVVVPLGPPKPPQNPPGTCLLYNEYIVYNTAQIRMKYLLMVKFNYKSSRGSC